MELAGGGPGGGALWCSLARVTSVGVGGGGDSALCGGGGGIRRLSETNFESGNGGGGPLPFTHQLNCCLLFFTFLTLSLFLSAVPTAAEQNPILCVCFCAILCASVCVCTCLPRICTAHTECPQSATVTALHTLCTQTQRVSHDKGGTLLLILSIQTNSKGTNKGTRLDKTREKGKGNR